MKKILFPFEVGCPCYREAYVYAVKLARNLGAELILLNAFDVQVDNDVTVKQYELLIRSHWIRAYKEIILFHDYYLSDHARVDAELNIKTDHRIIHGMLQDEFRRILRDEKIDLVVMPVTGESETTRKNLKQMRKDVLARDRSSLLVTPGEKGFVPLKDIMLAFGMKRSRELSPYLTELMKFADIRGSVFHFAHLDRHTDPERLLHDDFRNSLAEVHQMEEQIAFHEVFGRDLEQRLLRLLQDNNIRLLGIAGSQMQAIGELFRTNIFDEICMNHRIPVVVLSDPASHS